MRPRLVLPVLVLIGIAVAIATGALSTRVVRAEVFAEAQEARPGPESEPWAAYLERARALQRQVPLIDSHNDFAFQVRQRADRDLNKLDMAQPQPGVATDIERLRKGGVGGLFWSAYAPISGQKALADPHEAVRGALEQIDVIHQIWDRYPVVFAQALTADDMMRIFRSGKIGGFIGLESGHHIDSSLGALRMFYKLGVRYMTLTWNDPVPWADTWFLPPKHNGLTKFGEEVVREMNRLGMFVDIAHVHELTMAAVMRVTEAPVLISHGSARATGDVGRNVPDSIIAQLPKNGGVLDVFFMQQYTTTAGARHAEAETTERNLLMKLHPNDQAAVRAGLDAWRKAHPTPKTSVMDVADAIDHIRKVASIDNIGIGSDFDGGANIFGLEDVSKFPNLTAELLRRGYSDDDVKKILGLNVLRAMRGVEMVAKRLQAQRPPSPALIEQLDKPKTQD
jgi:membrane dipeptidase